jgi:hypothetical protein
MQSFTNVDPNTSLLSSLSLLLANDETAISCNAGTAFPTTNLYVGMPCFRTDLNKLYQLTSTSPSVWMLVCDFNKTPIFAQDVAASYMPLAGGTHTGTVSLNYAAPQLAWLDSTQSNGAGRFRWISSGGSMILQRNTATAGDFSSATAPVTYGSNDVATFAVRPVFGSATPWDTGNFNPANYFPVAGGQFTGHVTSVPTAGSTTSGNVSSMTIQNNGGTGDGNVAALSFLCQSNWGLQMHLRADGYFGIGGWSASAWRWYVNTGTGDMIAAGNIGAYSDPRLKEDVEPIKDALNSVLSLNGVRFTWRDHAIIGKPGKRDVGVMSPDVRRVLPEAVSTTAVSPDGVEYDTVAYDKLSPLLIEALKEFVVETRAEIQKARAEVKTLRRRVTALEKKLQ